MGSDHLSPYRADGKLHGFVCVVTSATQPGGWAIVHELATHGAACIYACDDPAQGTRQLGDEIAESYPNTKLVGYPLKPEIEEATLQLIDDVLNAWGRLDVWVACATTVGALSIEATTPHNLLKCFEANSMAPFWALKYCPPAMGKMTPKGNYPNSVPKDRKYGSIIVVSSVASTHGGTGVRINCISTGHADSSASVYQLSPADLAAEDASHDESVNVSRQVARVVGFLASGFSSYITGANLVVDGGAS